MARPIFSSNRPASVVDSTAPWCYESSISFRPGLPTPTETGWIVSTILVADDNSNIQKMVGIALKELGIEVIAVGNGEAAVRKLAESVPDLILADIFMPVRNGYEVCEYVKKDDRFAHVPVVLLVGAFDPLDEREVERVRADGVLKKPFVPPDPLIELVKSLLGKAAAAASAQEAAPAEDVEQTQDISAGLSAHSPTGTMRIPAPEPPPTERTQRLEPEPPARLSSGTVEVARPEIPSVDRTQRLTPEGTLESVETFKLGLEEPASTPAMEKTQQLDATDISKILTRESSLSAPAEPETEEEEFALPPSTVDFHGAESPLAFEDMLRPTDEAEAEEEEKGDLGEAAFEAAEEETTEESADEAEIRFGGIREEAKTPDPERPPIPVDFGHSEPMEIVTDEDAESSEHEIGPTEDSGLEQLGMGGYHLGRGADGRAGSRFRGQRRIHDAAAGTHARNREPGSSARAGILHSRGGDPRHTRRAVRRNYGTAETHPAGRSEPRAGDCGPRGRAEPGVPRTSRSRTGARLASGRTGD